MPHLYRVLFWLALLACFARPSFAQNAPQPFILAPDAAHVPPLQVGLSDSYAIELAWSAILKEAGISHKKMVLPHRRRRRMFAAGEILLDCCVTPEWRNTEEENAVQLFSNSIYESEERYVFKKGAVINIDAPSRLTGLRIATIEGFVYGLQDYFGTRIPVRDVDAMLQMVESGRAQVAIVSKTDFIFHMAKKPRDLVMGGVNASVDLRVRVHKNRADLLPVINKAIETLRQNGQLKKLIETPPAR